MSYRSFKRVLGETHLELKCLLLFGVSLLALLAGSFFLYRRLTEKLVYEEYRNTGKLLVDQEMYEVHWKALETNDQFKEVVKDLTDNLSAEVYGSEFWRPGDTDGEVKPGDEFEWGVFDEFIGAGPVQSPEDEEPEDASDTKPRFKERLFSERNEYQYYQPIYANAQSCVTCHNAFEQTGESMALGGSGISRRAPIVKGELMSVVKITIPYGPMQRALNWNRAILISIAIITVFAAMIAFYVTIRYVIVKPLRHLRDVSDEISHGNIALRAEIHTGDEFEALAVAFNRMLRNLVSVQEDLRDVNADLDAKVDELAQMNMRLYEMNAVKSDFLATMSHELRTPLNSILGFSEVLESVDSLDEKQKRYVQNIRKSGSVLLEMINDILDLAKMESGKMDTRLTEFSIEQIISAQCDMARPLAEKKNIDLEYDIDKSLPPLRQDQARVQQILNNLLSNAIKFTPEGGRISIDATGDDNDFVVIRVVDTGVGIAEEDQHSIFEKFRQARNGGGADAMTREYSGTGLGLSIVKELCKILGGEVTLESELGRGSVFTVRLPRQLQEQPRLDSALADGFEEFAKPRLEMHRPVDSQPQAAD